MTLQRWDPFGELVSLRQAMDRLLEDAVVAPSRLLGGRAGQSAGMGLDVDLIEHENELEVKASLPGVRPEDVDISLEDNVLTIQGEVREERTDGPGPQAS